MRADVAKVWAISFASSDLPPQALRLRSLASFQWQRCLQKVITILKHHLFWEKQEEIDGCLISPLPPGPPPPPPCSSPPLQFKKNFFFKSPTGSVVKGRGRPGVERRRWLRALRSRVTTARLPHEWVTTAPGRGRRSRGPIRSLICMDARDWPALGRPGRRP